MVNYLLYRFGQFLALSLPLKLSYKVAVFFSDINYVFAGKDRRDITENLKIIFPEKDSRQIRVIRRQIFRNFAKYLVDFFRFSKLNIDYIEKNIKIENIKYIDEALSRGKGVIIVTAHLGNWELGGVVVSQLGYPFWAVALPHKHKKVDEFFNSQRESKGLKVIPLGRAVRACVNVLKENMVLALVGDRDFTGKGMVLDFFGKPTIFPEGAAVFSLKTGAPIIPGFMMRNDDDSFTLSFEKPIEMNMENKDKPTNLKKIMSYYNSIFEEYIRKHPSQWYMFKRFWKED